jgi:NitT/TauT family transport system ATP-binding protein
MSSVVSVRAASSPIGLSIERATRSFGAVRAVDDVSLEIAAGAFVALIGPSGCGKTTLLRMIGGLDAPDSGAIRFRDADGAQLEPAECGISICFQEPRLLPWRDVLANVELPLELRGVPSGERRDRAEAILVRMQLGDALRRRPGQLSGGMRMRAAMARALVTRPRLLLLDEPFGALDDVTRLELDEELHRIWSADGFTAILVTHSIPEAVHLATRAVVFSPRPASIVADRAVALPVRGPLLRTSDPFNDVVRELSIALQRAMRGGEVRA